jgi:TM2 domain-containing membrane protein YozV
MTRFCSSCGTPVPETAKFCNECGARLIDRVFAGQLSPAQDAGGEKSTFLAVAGSTFVPGLGQVYEGNVLKGYLVFFGTFFGFFLLIIPGLIIWLYGIYDAYSTADRMNRGVVPFEPAPTLHMVIFVVVAIVVAIVAFIVIMYLVMSFSGPLLNNIDSGLSPSISNTDINTLIKQAGGV